MSKHRRWFWVVVAVLVAAAAAVAVHKVWREHTMTEALASDDPAARHRAVIELSERKHMGTLVKVLRTDPSPVVRDSAVIVLLQHYLGPKGAVGGPADPPIRLGDIDELVAKAFIDALSKDDDDRVRDDAASALGLMRWHDALPALFVAAERDGPARAGAIEAIGMIADPGSCRRLTAMWEVDRPGTRDGVAHLLVMSALVAIGKPAIPALELTLKDGSPHARTLAAETLGGIGGAEAERLLQIATGDLDIDVREQAQRSLDKLKANH